MGMDKYYNNPSKDDEGAAHKHESTEPEHEKPGSINLGIKLDSIVGNKYLLIGLAVVIILLNIILRAGLLQYPGLFEPDGFFYYAVIKQAIASHFVVSNYLNISGFPLHNFIGEARGLIYLTVIAYYLLHGITGLSALTIMRWMPILFGVLYAILAYFIAKEISNSKVLGLLAMFFVSVSSGNIARTAGSVYRGDSFITLFIMLALLLMLKCFQEKKHWMKWVWGLLSSVGLATGIVVWTGSPFIIVIYLLALLFAIFYGFVKFDKNILLSSLIVSIALLVMHILQVAYVSAGIARAAELSGNNFLLLYVPILACSIAAYYLVSRKGTSRILSTAKNRLMAALVAILIIGVAMLALFGPALSVIASPLAPATNTTVNSNGVNSTVSRSIGSTTQELQAPTYSFLWSSFSLQLFLAPLGIAIFVLIAFLVYKGERLIKRDHFNLSIIGFLVVLAYLLVTVYMQAEAIRFNAIVSVPLAILSAFAVYAAGKIFYNSTVRKRSIDVAILIVIAIVAIAIIYWLYGTLSYQFSMAVIPVVIWVCITAEVLIIIILIALLGYCIYGLAKGRTKLKYVILAIVFVIIIFTSYNTYFESYTAAQADGINPGFLNAMTWMKNNTPTNSTVLALWPDGSVVEGWANRTSYMDSVGGENGSRIYPFSKWLFSTTTDGQYFYNIGKPDYLVARSFWYQELGGIAQEGLVTNASAYGYVILPVLNITSNATTQFFTFSGDTYPYYKSELLIEQQANGTSKFAAYLGLENGTKLALMKSVIFFNTTSAAYSITNTSKMNNSINYTLLVSYSGREISGAYILGPKLTQSNLFKLTFLCNTFECAYNDSNVTLTAVYVNSDTRIYKINYLR